MLVKAKCTINVFDNATSVFYTPGGGPFAEGLYEIDRDGQLAKIKLGSTYCFDFDRTPEQLAVDSNDPDADRTCYICTPPKVLQNSSGLRLHNQKSHPFQSQPESVAGSSVSA